eukprot:106833_1
MCINNGNVNYHKFVLCVCIGSLPILLTHGAIPHIQIETKLSTLEDITIGVLALVLCIVLSFAGYFIYLRIVINRVRTSTFVSNQLITINEEETINDTTSLLKRTKTIPQNLDFDANLRVKDDDKFQSINRNSNQSSYVSFGVYGAVDDKDKESTLS